MDLTPDVYDQVEALARIGCTLGEIQLVLGINDRQLAKRRKTDVEFEDRYQRGVATMKVSLRRMQLQAAQKGNVAMLIWLGKQFLGQADKVDVNGEIQETFVLEVPKKEAEARGWEEKWQPAVIEGGRA